MTRVGLAIGDKLTLRIADIAFGGEGVARLDDFVVFVPFVALNETVEAEIVEVKKQFARTRLRRVIEASPQRVQPRCPWFGQCGGCQYQHIDYPAQLQLKQKQVGDLFQRLAKIDPAVVAPIIPCPQAYGYRNRIMVRSQWDKFKRGLNIGFLRADSRLVVDVEECAIADPALNAQLKEARAKPPPHGGIKVVLRIPPEGWDLPPDSFFQNNFLLLPELIRTVRQMLLSAGTRHLADIYCGVGFFRVELAGVVESFAGLELDQLAVKAARRNAAARGLTNGGFHAGAAEALLPGLLERFAPEKTTVLLDPPRKGCRKETLCLLRAVRPAQIVYVSCNPATMARDLKNLCAENGPRLHRVVPLDMFPQTQHVECVADLRNTP
jgi:tRNA/tmRNA/rRNA uracil-C5-methylase (TrmA/RlmC/RlmD family)